MSKPRPNRAEAGVHPDDVWRPGEEARMKRRLLNRLMQEWTPEMREEYRLQRDAERAAAKARREGA